MSLITEKELKKIVELANTVPDEYRQKCFELLLSVALGYSTKPPEVVVSEPSGGDKTTPPPKPFVLPIDVKAFLTQYGLDESLLHKFFLLEGTEIRPTYELQTTKKAKAQIQHALMMALETALSTGQFQVERQSLRNRCNEQRCYDASNFITHIKAKEHLFKSVAKDEPLSLSPEGKSELADLLEQLKA